MSEKIVVEVVYAYPERYFLKKITLENPITIQNAIVQSGVLEKYTEIDLHQNKYIIVNQRYSERIDESLNQVVTHPHPTYKRK